MHSLKGTMAASPLLYYCLLGLKVHGSVKGISWWQQGRGKNERKLKISWQRPPSTLKGRRVADTGAVCRDTVEVTLCGMFKNSRCHRTSHSAGFMLPALSHPLQHYTGCK